MSAPSKQSRWGSFLSQAVNGLESRLDTILANEEAEVTTREAKPLPPSRSSSTRSSSTAPKSANDRLQARLAKAVAAKQGASATHKSTASRSSLGSAGHSPRPSSDLQGQQRDGMPDEATTNGGDETQAQTSTNGALTQESSPRASTQDVCPDAAEPATPSEVHEESVAVSVSTSEKIVASLDLYEKRIEELEKDLEVSQQQHQEELHDRVEQVDALQAKLQYLAREATESAKKAASEATAGSLEKKLAEKDQQVAQLMGEGQKLAANEQKLRAVIKKLRGQIAVVEKELNDQKIQRQKTDLELSRLREESRNTDSLKKASTESQKQIAQLKRDLERVKSDLTSKDQTILDLKAQLQEESGRVKIMAAKIDDEAREAGQQRIKELEDSVAALKVEKDLVADRAKAQAADFREKTDRAAERSTATEVELRGEIQILESKLEAVRTRAEEASSGAIGDAQAKLLRQIETLQTQYSIASENWQGMEASLLARATNLERERDEALQRESDMRRKAREAASRAKRQEEELEEVKTRLPSVQESLADYQSQLEALRKRAEDAESALAGARAGFEKQRLAWKEEREEIIEKSAMDRRPWLEETRSNSRPASPLLSAPQRTFSGDLLGLMNFPTKLRKTSGASSNGDHSPGERPMSTTRRPSHQPPSRPTLMSAPSAHSPTPVSILGGEVVNSPPHGPDRESVFDPAETPASPQNVLQDMVSVSTVAAGPSVQLVERMSAAIRRLESEKVAAKEELARISGQRDEARAEIVALIKEVEAAKIAARKVEGLEKEMAEVNERYQTTLEMLGEKSELVEELRADVDDVKAMYRDLVERAIK